MAKKPCLADMLGDDDDRGSAQFKAGKKSKDPVVETGTTQKSGSYKGKSNALGAGGRAQQMKDAKVPGGVIGDIARSKNAAPGQKNFKGKKGK